MNRISIQDITKGFIKYVCIKTRYMPKNEEQRFDMIMDIESLFYIYADTYKGFLSCIEKELNKKEFLTTKWQKILKEIYDDYTIHNI